MRPFALIVVLAPAACLPPVAPLAGKACDAQGRCPEGLVCATGVCLDPADVPDAGSDCPPGNPDVVFCSGFEEGSKAIWDDNDMNPDTDNQLIEDPGPFGRPGNHVAWMKEHPGESGSDLVKVLPTAHDLLYARWYVKYPAGFDLAHAFSSVELHAGSRTLLGEVSRPTGTDYASVELYYDPTERQPLFLGAYLPGMYQSCTSSTACYADTYPCVYDATGPHCSRAADRPTVPSPTLETDRWYCMEMKVDTGAPTSSATGAGGSISFWQDGAELGTFNGLWFRSVPDLKLTVLYLLLYRYADPHSLVGLYYDDVVASTSRVGCH